MAGLGRIQQRFNVALVATLAALVRFVCGGSDEDTEKLLVDGHPILAKYLKRSNPNANTPGYAYPGYCAGVRETVRRRHQQEVVAQLFTASEQEEKR